jgi:hypothetical protein
VSFSQLSFTDITHRQERRLPAIRGCLSMKTIQAYFRHSFPRLVIAIHCPGLTNLGRVSCITKYAYSLAILPSPSRDHPIQSDARFRLDRASITCTFGL